LVRRRKLKDSMKADSYVHSALKIIMLPYAVKPVILS
jgi:hypothetical protein